MVKVTVVKIGGQAFEDLEKFKKTLTVFSEIEGYKVLVHGGGCKATSIATQLGIESKMVNGRRITDRNMLDVVTMVYGGLVNKQIVAGLQSLGVNALGLTGADLNCIFSKKRPVKGKEVDYGFVGEVKEVNTDLFADLISKGVVPVLAPLTHDKKGNLLNTNADTIAAEVAMALSTYFEVSLIYCTEKKGVLMDTNDENSLISQITKSDFKNGVSDGTITGGMIPKLENAFCAIESGVKEVLITSTHKESKILIISGTKVVG